MDFLVKAQSNCTKGQRRFQCRDCCQPSTKAFGSAAALLPFTGQAGGQAGRQGWRQARREEGRQGGMEAGGQEGRKGCPLQEHSCATASTAVPSTGTVSLYLLRNPTTVSPSSSYLLDH